MHLNLIIQMIHHTAAGLIFDPVTRKDARHITAQTSALSVDFHFWIIEEQL